MIWGKKERKEREEKTYRSQRAPPSAQLTIDDDRSIRRRPDHNVDQVLEISIIGRLLSRDRDARILHRHFMMFIFLCCDVVHGQRRLRCDPCFESRVHDVLENEYILRLDFFPNRDDSAVAGFSVKKEANVYLL